MTDCLGGRFTQGIMLRACRGWRPFVMSVSDREPLSFTVRSHATGAPGCPRCCRLRVRSGHGQSSPRREVRNIHGMVLVSESALERLGCREGNRAKESDVITELQDDSVVVTNTHIDVDAGENVVNWFGYLRVF
jgi:hypothetical protein